MSIDSDVKDVGSHAEIKNLLIFTLFKDLVETLVCQHLHVDISIKKGFSLLLSDDDCERTTTGRYFSF